MSTLPPAFLPATPGFSTALVGLAGDAVAVSSSRGSTPATLVTSKSPIYALPQDGSRLAWIEAGVNPTNDRADRRTATSARGITTRVSVSSDGSQTNGESLGAAIAADGRYVLFTSQATNLVRGDTNGKWDAFMRDLRTGVTSRISVSSDGAEGNDDSGASAISANGRYVVFSSGANNLVRDDTNDNADVFLRDLRAGVTTRVSVAGHNREAIHGKYGSEDSPAISADGRYVAFDSDATDIVPRDTNRRPDVFMRDRLARP